MELHEPRPATRPVRTALLAFLAGVLVGPMVLVFEAEGFGAFVLLLPSLVLAPVAWGLTRRAARGRWATCAAALLGSWVSALGVLVHLHAEEGWRLPVAAALWTGFAVPGVLAGRLAAFAEDFFAARRDAPGPARERSARRGL